MKTTALRLAIPSALLKFVCERNNIPTPTSGHWTKRAMGQDSAIPALPPPCGASIIHLDVEAELYRDSKRRIVRDATINLAPGESPSIVRGRSLSNVDVSDVIEEMERKRLRPLWIELFRENEKVRIDEQRARDEEALFDLASSGMPLTEVATMMGVPVSTIRRRFAKGIRRLRRSSGLDGPTLRQIVRPRRYGERPSSKRPARYSGAGVTLERIVALRSWEDAVEAVEQAQQEVAWLAGDPLCDVRAFLDKSAKKNLR